jgi:lysozyme family protein
MTNFENAIGIVLANEWGYKSPEAAVRDGDPGGETFCGIARNKWPQWEGWEKIDPAKAALKIPQLIHDENLIQSVKNFFRDNFYNPLYDQIESPEVARKLFDTDINMGTEGAVRILQLALASVGSGAGPMPAPDGKFGPKTLDYVNGANPEHLLQEMRARMAKRYAMTAAARPLEQADLLGWMRRAVQ